MMDSTPTLRHVGIALASLFVPLASSGCGDDGSQDDTTATAGSTDTDGGTATGGGTDCEGVELVQGGVLDLNIPAVDYVVISGQILLNGDTLADAEGPRGAIRFDYTPSAGRPGSVTYTLEATGAETYSVVVPAGETSVHYVPDEALCAAHPEGPMPCTGGALVEKVALVDSGVLDLDIPAIVASGAISQDGAVLPDAAGDRGHLEFSLAAETVGVTAGLGPTGPASYTVALFPGTYDVAFAGNPELCAEGAAPVPCNTGVVISGLSLSDSGVLDVDVPHVEVSGAVTVNGEPMADGADDRGALRFDPAGMSEVSGLATAPFGATGPVSYGASLVAGSYSVALVANPAQCAGDVPPTPCVGGTLLASLDLSSDGVLDVDIPRIDLSGKVTLAGADLPDEAGDRGSVVFSGGSGEAATVGLGSAGSLTYALGLLPGEYAITFAANPGLCDGMTAPSMPCGGGTLSTLPLMSSGVLDVDVPVVAIAGKVTLAGATLPDQTSDRGSVVFSGSGEAGLALPLGTGPFDGYAVTLMPGSYDVAYMSGAEECVGPPDDAMPCGGGRLVAGVSLASDGVLDLDIPAIEISGRVTYIGEGLPSLGDPRGALSWSSTGDSPGLTIDLGADGAKSYAVVLVPGRWVVDHIANPALCDDGVPPFPCTDQALIGCGAP